MSLSMIVKITLEALYDLLHRESRPDIFDFNDILVVPIVNLDGYVHINKGYNQLGWDMTKYKRKNFNYTIACP